MLARRLTTILPTMTLSEAIDPYTGCGLTAYSVWPPSLTKPHVRHVVRAIVPKPLCQLLVPLLLSVIDSKRDYAIVLLAHRHGLRASEVGLLQCDDFNQKPFHLRIHLPKNSLAGLHPL